MPESDFIKRLEKYTEIGKIDARDKHYSAEIEPFLLEVAGDLSKKYAAKPLYPHVSNFRTHILFRLGPHKKTTHRASVAVSFEDDYIDTGFDLTHALGDGQNLRDLIREKTEEIAFEILKLHNYWIYIPNAGITKATPIESISLVKLKKALLKYDPQVMRECYFKIKKDYEGDTMTRKQLVEVFVEERKTFEFLLKGVI
jgi:hypothetical protein